MIIERADGSLVLQTRGDPAHDRVVGYKRYWLGADLGQHDPTGLVLMKDERLPIWKEGRQVLGVRNRVVVWCDFLTDTSYSAISEYLVDLMSRPSIRGKVRLSVDATGVGRAFSDFLVSAQVEHAAVQITAGMATTVEGRYHNVSKTVLLGALAVAIEQRHLLLAHDLPLRDRLIGELASFEVKTTAAGNQILNATRSEGTGHADLAIAASLVLYHSSTFVGSYGEGTLEGWY